jgi:hypothetical protein
LYGALPASTEDPKNEVVDNLPVPQSIPMPNQHSGADYLLPWEGAGGSDYTVLRLVALLE